MIIPGQNVCEHLILHPYFYNKNPPNTKNIYN